MKGEFTKTSFVRHRLNPLILICMIALFLYSCGDLAERDNPFDPNGTNYTNSGTLIVHVSDSYSHGLPEATVLIEETDQAFVTDAQGNATFELTPGNYTCIIQKDGFNSVEIDTAISLMETVNISETVFGIPSIDSVWSITAVTQTNTEVYLYKYLLYATTSDYDGSEDIITVALYEPGVTTPIDFDDMGEGLYQAEHDFLSDRSSMISLIGQPLRLVITDRHSNSIEQPFTIDNLFYYDHEDLFDTNSDYFNTDSLHFRWGNPRLEDWHHWFEPTNYRLEVKNPSSETLIDTSLYFPDTGMDTLSFTVYDHTYSASMNIYFKLYIYDPNGNYVITPEVTRTIGGS